MAAAATLGLGGPAPAGANVVITPARIELSTPAGTVAVIERDPYRLTVRDQRGRGALAESPNTAAAPALEPPTAYPPPLGQAPSRDPGISVFSPLSYLVGAKTFQQYNSGFWVGNMMGGTESGVVYAARAVRSVARVVGGVRLTLSTNDPTGRVLSVSIGPDQAGALRVSAAPVPSAGVVQVADAFTSGPDEAFHGFGGRHNSLDQHGSDLYSWNEEENFPAADGGLSGQPNYMFPNGPTAAYHAQPLFFSSRGYGFLLDQPDFARFRLDSDRPDGWSVAVAAAHLDYLIATGGPARAIGALTSITGRQRVPPRWATGPMLDRLVRSFGVESAGAYEQHVRDDLAALRRYHIHLDGYRIEGWGELPEATLRSFIAAFHRLGTHVMVYFPAFVANPTLGYQEPGAYEQAISQGLVATTTTGAPYTFGSPFAAGVAALLDFSNPSTVRWWQARIRRLLDAGADGFMQDFGEQAIGDMRFHDGESGLQMHNRYPILYHRATRELIDAYTRQHPGRQIFFFTRSGYTGRPGSLAYDNANFLGDNESDWQRINGIASVLSDMLNRGVGGAYGSTTDIGGYSDSTVPPPSKELFVRWAELAALTPFYRVHNGSADGTHTPWSYDAETLSIYKRYAALHLRARGLILRLWRAAERTGIPVMRPLWLAYPSDRTAALQDQEFLLGPDVLVAPVVEPGAGSRRLYLPAGCWREPDTHQLVHGPAALSIAAPLATLPYYFRCGRQPFDPPTRMRPTHRA